MDHKELRVTQVANEPGIKDLKPLIRIKVAKALIAEREGNHVEAGRLLDEAILYGLEG